MRYLIILLFLLIGAIIIINNLFVIKVIAIAFFLMYTVFIMILDEASQDE